MAGGGFGPLVWPLSCAPSPVVSCIFLGRRPVKYIQAHDGAGLYGGLRADLITSSPSQGSRGASISGVEVSPSPQPPSLGALLLVLPVTQQACVGSWGWGLSKGSSRLGHLDVAELLPTLCVRTKRAFWRWTQAWFFPIF